MSLSSQGIKNSKQRDNEGSSKPTTEQLASTHELPGKSGDRGGFGWCYNFREDCLASWQCPVSIPGDTNREVIENVGLDDPLFGECLSIAKDVISGEFEDPADSATHHSTRGPLSP
jgi:hypothetical protein